MIIDNAKSDWLKEQTKVRPDKIFIIGEKEHYTFSEVYKSVIAFTRFLSGKIKRHSYVPLLCENNPDFIVATFAIWQTGAVPVLINHKLKQHEVTEILRQFEYDYILLHSGLTEKFSLQESKKIVFPVHRDVEIEETYDSRSEATAVVLFTSGSRGKPKGVKISFENLWESVFSFDSAFELSEKDKLLASLPFYHIGGFSIIVRSILSGAQIIFPANLKTGNILRSIKKHKPTFISLVPTMLKRLTETGLNHYSGLKNIFVGGGPSAQNILISAINKQLPITLVYGATETSSMIAEKKIDNNFTGESFVVPMRNVKITIVDEQRNELPAYSKGEIVVTAPQVAEGYLNNPDSTAEKFEGKSFYTGDYGYTDNTGKLFILGRKDDLIISGGENINPAEIEYALTSYPEIEDAYVFGEANEEWGESLVAAIKISDDSKLNIYELKEYLRKKIAPFKIPKKFFFVESIPRTQLGKVNKPELIKKINS